MAFRTFGLNDSLMRGVDATGYKTPTEIQTHAIPPALLGHDLIGCAQTGTGKTAAFVLPILNRLAVETVRPGKKQARAVILTPTRELALQIESSIREYGRYLKIHTLAIYGGVSIEAQMRALLRGVDIAVCTPGRLLDHMNRQTIDLTRVEVLVVDEADRMFDMGFIRDVKKIVSAMPRERQTLLFSATLSPEIRELTGSIQRTPQMIQVGKQHNPIDTVTQHIYPVQQQQKIGLLLHLLESQQMNSVLIFSRTKHGADRIRWRLDKAGIDSVSIHSDRSQSQRIKALEGFRRGKFRVMVATDIAARGIDVDGISHVINFDVPAVAEDYIHRIGRTGRASATGDAITFVGHDEHRHLRQIERFIGRRFEHKTCDEFVYDYPLVPENLDAGSERTGRGGKFGKSKFGRPGGFKQGGKPGFPRRKTAAGSGNSAQPGGHTGQNRFGNSAQGNRVAAQGNTAQSSVRKGKSRRFS